MKIVSSSPGKVILFGEHFVVKGNRAIASAIDLRTEVTLEPKDSWPILIESRTVGGKIKINKDLSYTGNSELSHFIRILELIKEKGTRLKPFRAFIGGRLPVAMGLGSSASSAASLSAAVLRYYGIDFSKSYLFQITNEVEKLVHERPSGVDSAIVVYGGTIVYRKGESPQQLDVRWREDYKVMIACTRSKRNTGEVVMSVLELAERYWRVLGHVYKAAEALVEEAINLIKKGDIDSLGSLMNINQGLLYAINVSSLDLEELIFSARESGCIGSKLTGAGRGGCIISLCKGLKEVPEGIRRLTDIAFITRLGAPGTTVKTLV